MDLLGTNLGQQHDETFFDKHVVEILQTNRCLFRVTKEMMRLEYEQYLPPSLVKEIIKYKQPLPATMDMGLLVYFSFAYNSPTLKNDN